MHEAAGQGRPGPGSTVRRTPGRRSRRRGVAGAAAALVAAGTLAACGSDDGGPPTLTWYINPDAGGQAEIANRCTEAAGGALHASRSSRAAARSPQPARAAGPPARRQGLLDRHHEPGPAVHPRVRRGRFPRPGAGRRRRSGSPRTSCRARSPAPRWDGRAGRRAVLGQHPAALVPQVGRGGGRAGHGAAGDLGPDHRGGRSDQDKHHRGPGHPRRVADGVDQRARSSPPAARSSRTRPATAGRAQARPGDPRPAAEAARDHRTMADAGVGGPALSDRRRGRERHRTSRAATAAFMVNWPFVWPRAQRRGRGRHPRPVACPTTSAGRSTRRSIAGRAEPRRRTAGSTSASARSASTPTSPTRPPSASSPRRTRPTTSSTNGNPASQAVGLRRPGGRSRRSRWPPYPRVPRARGPAAADRRTTTRSPPACSGPPPADRGRPGRHGRTADRPDHRRPARGAAAVSTTTLRSGPGEGPEPRPAPQRRAQRPGAGRAAARLDARRPGVRR